MHLIFPWRAFRLQQNPLLAAAHKAPCIVLLPHPEHPYPHGLPYAWGRAQQPLMKAATGQLFRDARVSGAKVCCWDWHQPSALDEFAKLLQELRGAAPGIEIRLHLPMPVWPRERAALKALTQTAEHKNASVHTHWTQLLHHPEDLPVAPRNVPNRFSDFRHRSLRNVRPRPFLQPPLHFKPLSAQLGATLHGFESNSPAFCAAREVFTAPPSTQTPATSTTGERLSLGVSAVPMIWQRLKAEQPEADPEPFIRRDHQYLLAGKFAEKLNSPTGVLGLNWSATPPDNHLQAWQAGETGFPFADALLRKLQATHQLSHRQRQVVGDFWLKFLGGNWLAGAEWFAQTLRDFDPALTWLNWHYLALLLPGHRNEFRYLDPVLQGEKLDPEGALIREWVPELARLSGRNIHQPHRLPAGNLAKKGIHLPKDYPMPVIDSKQALEAAQLRYRRALKAANLPYAKPRVSRFRKTARERGLGK